MQAPSLTKPQSTTATRPDGSFDAFAWNRATMTADNGLTGIETFVGIGVGKWADSKTGIAWFFNERLAAELKHSDKTIRDALKGLVAKGWLTRIGRAGPDNRCILYRLHVPPVAITDRLPLPNGKNNNMAVLRSVAITARERYQLPTNYVPNSLEQQELPRTRPLTIEAVVEPAFFQVLKTLPGWSKYGVACEVATAWIESRGIVPEYAEETALALKSKWGGPGWKRIDPWATFQTWVKRPPLPSRAVNNLAAGQGGRYGHNGTGKAPPVNEFTPYG